MSEIRCNQSKEMGRKKCKYMKRNDENGREIGKVYMRLVRTTEDGVQTTTTTTTTWVGETGHR